MDNNQVVQVGRRVDKMFKNLSESKKLKNQKFRNPIHAHIKAIE